MVPWDEPSHWDGQLKRTGAHSAVVTAAKVHDKPALPHLLHGKEQRVYGNSAYASQKT
jgi:transposase, IS5 family